jgi:hypothetical protein
MKSIDVVIRKTAGEMGIPEDQAKVVVMEYWNTIYKKLLSGEETAITVRHVGTFAMSRFKLYRLIRRRIGKIRYTKKNEKITEEFREIILADEYKKLSLAMKHRNTIAIEYAENFGNI